jgi:hypothetical protein
MKINWEDVLHFLRLVVTIIERIIDDPDKPAEA